jgi:hypothetical protein
MIPSPFDFKEQQPPTIEQQVRNRVKQWIRLEETNDEPMTKDKLGAFLMGLGGGILLIQKETDDHSILKTLAIIGKEILLEYHKTGDIKD